jgi:hypothetical protein
MFWIELYIKLKIIGIVIGVSIFGVIISFTLFILLSDYIKSKRKSVCILNGNRLYFDDKSTSNATRKVTLYKSDNWFAKPICEPFLIGTLVSTVESIRGEFEKGKIKWKGGKVYGCKG